MQKGIWAEDSDDDVGETSDMRQSKRKGPKDYSAPVSFVSGGVQQSGKKKKKSDEDDVDDSDTKKGLGFAGKEAQSSASEEDERPTFKPQQMAGMRQAGHQAGASKKGNIFIQ